MQIRILAFVASFLLVLCLPLTRASEAALVRISTPHQAVTIELQRPPHYRVPERLSWLPHSHTLLYDSATPNGVAEIQSIDVVSGALRNVTDGLGVEPSPDGRTIAFVRFSSSAKGESQIWIASSDGSHARQVTSIPGGIGDPSSFECGIAWATDSRRLAYFFLPGQAHFHKAVQNYSGARQASVQVYRAGLSTLLQAQYGSAEVHVLDILHRNDRRVLQAPYEQLTDLQWSSDGRSLLFDETDQHAQGASFEMHGAIVRLWLDGRHENLVENLGRNAFKYLQLSPAGNRLLFLADPDNMRYPFQTDVAVMDLRTHAIHLLTHNLQIETSFWSPDGRHIYFVTGTSTDIHIHVVDLSGSTRQVTYGVGSSENPIVSGDGRLLAYIQVSPDQREDLHLASPDGRDDRRIRTLYDPLAGYQRAHVDSVRWKSSDGLEIGGYLVEPLGFQAGKKYPLIVFVHGGPCCAGALVSMEWAGGLYATEMFAARGFLVFLPDYRSGQRYGWDQILKARQDNDMFDLDYNDIMSGVDAVIQSGSVDTSRMAVLGHSWGSYEVNWIITHTNRFQVAVSYEGGADMTYNWGRKYGANDSTEWYLKGTPYDRPEAYRKESAITYVKGVTTPTLFINAEFGWDDPSMEYMYAALRRQGVDTEFVLYKGEDHNVQRPESSFDLLSRTTSWIEQHLAR